ncbi:MAG: hypothetical protein ACK40V_04880 [Anaerolineales bacterium]
MEEKLSICLPPSLEGSDWEQIFASCISAQWESSNVGLDDVTFGVCATLTILHSSRTVRSLR